MQKSYGECRTGQEFIKHQEIDERVHRSSSPNLLKIPKKFLTFISAALNHYIRICDFSLETLSIPYEEILIVRAKRYIFQYIHIYIKTSYWLDYSISLIGQTPLFNKLFVYVCLSVPNISNISNLL